MNTREVPTLTRLAARSLVKHEALDTHVLQELPVELFPPLFMEAYENKHSRSLKILLQNWPFSRLPLGALMKTAQVKPILDSLLGLDELNLGNNYPKRLKLRVLDLGTRPQNFWDVWSGHTDDAYLPEARDVRAVIAHNRKSGAKHPFQVWDDVCLQAQKEFSENASIFRWVRRKAYLGKVGCPRLHVTTFPVFLLKQILNDSDLNTVLELKVHCTENEPTVDTIFAAVGQMRNLQELLFYRISDPGVLLGRENVALELCKKMKKLTFLRKIYLSNVFFLKDNLGKICRSLNASLETLSISDCELTESDWKDLDLHLKTSKLKTLCLCSVNLSSFSFITLQALLKRVSGTLTTFKLEECKITDSHINDLLPTLSHCQQLTTISFYGNTFSTTILKDILLKTASMRQLNLELYPAPQESYYTGGAFNMNTIAQLFPQLRQHLRAIRQPKEALLYTKQCIHCGKELIYHL
ncbi:PRAME family member 20-like [Dipodomys merriami]|uniref:PRAME family member 20-like n=1 Tax=Dipodomys merriami TaxID=94247 RepID=UPI003855AB65